jgi:hypothetical protein
MVSVRPIAASDFERIYPLLGWHDPSLGIDVWRRIFDYAWYHDEPHCGYGLFDGDEAVGFIGFIFSERRLAEQTVRFCNLTTWVVKPAYRGHSLSLMVPLMRLKDYTITDLSAGEGVIQISKRLGFQDLDTAVQVLLPYRQAAIAPGSQIFTGDEIAPLPLQLVDQIIFNDHRPYANCQQLVLQSEQGYCHIVYTLNRDPELSYCHIQAISDVVLFERHQGTIRQRIIRDSGIPLIVIDARLVQTAELPASYRLPLESARIYRSSQLKPTQIDNLYSELMLLEFSTASSLMLGWKEKVLARCIPAIRHLTQFREPHAICS